MANSKVPGTSCVHLAETHEIVRLIKPHARKAPDQAFLAAQHAYRLPDADA